jgi:orotate phosphoribosyltransferase
MERGLGELSAVQEVQQAYAVPVVAVATLDDLLTYLGGRAELAQNLQAVLRYRQQYGIKK